jgi:2-polyprenyl-6-methoxyphenol hydroxylase-like FAD-dependent oxidoreductase
MTTFLKNERETRSMALPDQALIIGGGIGGMCAAIELRKLGITVDLIELNPEWSVYGAGITISGPTLRALRSVGVVDEVLAHAGTWDRIHVCAADGSTLAEVPIPPAAGADELPRSSGILRPVLAEILARATLASGTQVHTGLTFETITQDADGVDVRFTDGRQGRYGLVIGADGVHSQVRHRLFPHAPVPRFTGQGSWRTVVPRTVVHSTIYMGATTKVGVNPVSDEECYLFCLDQRPGIEFIPQEDWARMLPQLLAEFGGVVGDIRDGLRSGRLDGSRILYRPLAGLMMPAPWHLGRVLLLGDACHATTPHLASGAGIAVEDAVVLAEELQRHPTLDAALAAHTARRFERARLVVDSSLRLGELEQTGGPKDEHERVMRHALGALTAPI